jgi:hypothetical protein
MAVAELNRTPSQVLAGARRVEQAFRPAMKLFKILRLQPLRYGAGNRSG